MATSALSRVPSERARLLKVSRRVRTSAMFSLYFFSSMSRRASRSVRSLLTTS